jgi:4'-phosphopantetheinyl transferase EntD
LTAPYTPERWLAHPYGVLYRVAIPDDGPPPEVMGELHPEEQAFAAGLSARRLGTWVAGRLALGAALGELGARSRAPLLATPRGAPLVPAGFVGSLSHKRHVAAALGARDEGARVGVDIEEAAPSRADISGHVLTEGEARSLAALAPGERWRGVIPRFSIKEAIYKALDPFVQRYVGFKEVAVDLGGEGAGAGFREVPATLRLAQGEGPFTVEAAWAEIEGLIVSVARIRPGQDAHT